MTNCLVEKGPYSKIYDLKGCADDKLLINNGKEVPVVHKRIWKGYLWCGCGGKDRAAYFNGMLIAAISRTVNKNRNRKNVI